MVETEFWKHYKQIQFTTGVLSYALQFVEEIHFEDELSYFRICKIVILAMIEKFDFIKDIQVAATFKHSSKYHAFLYWMSINLPTFSILFFFYMIGKLNRFLPSFLGYSEL